MAIDRAHFKSFIHLLGIIRPSEWQLLLLPDLQTSLVHYQ